MEAPKFTPLERRLLDETRQAAEAFEEIKALLNSPVNMARLKAKDVRERIIDAADRGLKACL